MKGLDLDTLSGFFTYFCLYYIMSVSSLYSGL